MDLLNHRMGLVILTDEALNVSNQLGTRVPACHVKVDNRASEQDKSFAASSYHGGFGYVPQGNVDHRGNPSMVMVKVGKLDPTHVSDLMLKIDIIDYSLHDLEEVLDTSAASVARWSRRCRLTVSSGWKTVRRVGTFSMLEYERKYHAVSDELSSAHRSFKDIRNRHQKLQLQHDNLVRDHKNILGILEKGGQIRPRKKPRTDGTGGADPRKT